VAYQEAMEVMEYKNVVGYAEIMHYDELSSTKYPKNSYFYPLETEYKLINAIKVGEVEKSKSIIEDVFDKNFSSKHISLKITKCFMFNMISTILKALDEINNIYNSSLFESPDSVDKLLECKTTFEIKTTLIDIIENLCSYVISQKKDTHKELIDDIITYVGSNYNDINFSITMIGEKFRMTPSYISKLFMEERREGLLDFINTTRLEKAKLLLREKRYSVNEVASMVGFGNNGTFIRAFKKYEGITPGKYS
jgi:YesN/AraC family two-component response regulator